MMDQYEFVRTAHRSYRKNISELVRMTGHAHNMIKKTPASLRSDRWSILLQNQWSSFTGIRIILLVGPMMGLLLKHAKQGVGQTIYL